MDGMHDVLLPRSTKMFFFTPSKLAERRHAPMIICGDLYHVESSDSFVEHESKQNMTHPQKRSSRRGNNAGANITVMNQRHAKTDAKWPP